MLFLTSIVVMLFIALALYEMRRTKYYLNPLSLFLIEWCIVLFFSELHLYGLYEPQDSTIAIFIIGIMMFILGYYVRSNTLKNYSFYFGHKKNYEEENYVPKYNVLLWSAALSIAFYMFYLYTVYKNLDTFNLWTVRHYLRRVGAVIGNQYLRALGSFVFGPISFSLPIITSVDFWFGEKNKKLFVMTVILTIIQMFATASRMTFVLFILYMCSIGLYKLTIFGKMNTDTNKRRIKRWIKMIILCGVVVFIIMSLSRKLSLLKSLYLQLSIPPVMFEIWNNEIEQKGLVGFGTTSMNGFLFPIFYFIRRICGMSQMPLNMQVIYDLINYTDSHWVDVGTGITANAYVSIFWFLYADARYIGIVVGMFAFGLYSGKSFLRIKRNINCKNLSLYCVCIVAVAFSLVRMQFAMANFALALCFLLFVAFKKVSD